MEPNNFGALHLLGVLASETGKAEIARQLLLRSIQIEPAHAIARANLAVALEAGGWRKEAAEACREALRLDPNCVDAWIALGTAFRNGGQIDEAIVAYSRAAEIRPGSALGWKNLGACYRDMGCIDKALQHFSKAMEVEPGCAECHSNYLHALHLHPGSTAELILTTALDWDRRHATPLRSKIQDHTNLPDPLRRLRVGYVSSDFCFHVVGQNLLPLLREHDRAQVEVFCYSKVKIPDSVTAEIRATSEHWREIARTSDAAAAESIRADGIDILMDLSLHSDQNCLLAFAHKPAPVQVSYLGYCSTTGLAAMDYRLSDPWMDSPETQGHYREKTWMLSQSYWCYEPMGPTPVPAVRENTEQVNFGCYNYFAKVSPDSMDLWAKILAQVPGSRLSLCVPAGSCREAVQRRFEDAGIAPERLHFAARQTWERYIEFVRELDIALDPFPHGGGITTMDALWMGVPVVTLAGRTAVGRGGRSILSNLGLFEMIAHTPEQYVEIAVSLARDRSRLAELRQTLRGRMERSPLRDARGFAREMECAFRGIWRNWCAEREGA